MTNIFKIYEARILILPPLCGMQSNQRRGGRVGGAPRAEPCAQESNSEAAGGQRH